MRRNTSTPARARQPRSTRPARPTAQPKTPDFITHIENNAQLVSRLQPLLPAGMTLAEAARGFKNEGQFVAALHLSENLKIPFAQLKAEMAGRDHDKVG
jgi:hypothetical protein